ncbi:MAG: hypothetical protein JRH20_05505 [Deltaproteobacteria bacterium]|nr:hypothetical protein [Deltaproteobacteria bacterium]
MKPNIFDRVFKYAPTTAVVPEENLTSEILAYFLEASPKFRESFLSALDCELGKSLWDVNTQETLHAPGRPWHDTRPDLILRNREQKVEVAVEVKLDAGVTYKKGVAQTRLYADYLQHQEEHKAINRGILVTLTRWHPPADLAAPADVHLRFGQLVEWLQAVGRDETDETRVLASQWENFLLQRRWVMVDPARRHLDAVTALTSIGELEQWMWDVAGAATSEACSLVNSWQTVSNTKCSEGRLGGGKYLCCPALRCHVWTEKVRVQLGFWYGVWGGAAGIWPTVYLGCGEGWKGLRKVSRREMEFISSWGSWLIYLDDISLEIGREHQKLTLSDLAIEKFRDALEELSTVESL